MKYRFRRCPKKREKTKRDLCALRFAGKNTLRILRPLPEPIEAIRLEDEAVARKSKPFSAFLIFSKKVFLAIGNFFKQIFSELRAAARKSIGAAKRLVSRTLLFISKKRRERKEKKIDSLPIFLGATLSSLLVCIITASYVILSFFMPYSRSYKSVVIPSLQGLRLDEVDLEDSSFNLLVQYESNPEIEDGRIISQAPAAGITRKIYDKNGYCTIKVTVSRQVLPTVPTELVGKDLRGASLALLNSGLSFTVKEKNSDIK